MTTGKTITLSPSGRQFDAVPGRSLLHAGLSAGMALPFRCSNGSCGDCRARVLRGSVHKLRGHDYVLTEREKSAGTCLLCSNTADTDLVLEITEACSAEDIPQQELRAKLCQLTESGGVTLAGFKFLRGNAFRFLPGQQASLRFDDGFEVTLYIASCPCNAQFVEFHLTETRMAATLREQLETRIRQLKPVSKVTVSGPAGRFTITENIQKPKVFVAVDGGFSKLQGLIEHVFNLESGVDCTLVWQATPGTGQYRHNLCRSWDDAIDEFHYVPLAAGANPQDEMINALTAQSIDWDEVEFYLAERDDFLVGWLLQMGVSVDRIICAD